MENIVRLSRTVDTPLAEECSCAACGETIPVGQGVLRYFGAEEQLASEMGRADHYPVHASKASDGSDYCPRSKREAGAQLEVKVIAGHSVETRWSKAPYSKFPITIWLDGKPTRRTFHNAYDAIRTVRKELETA